MLEEGKEPLYIDDELLSFQNVWFSKEIFLEVLTSFWIVMQIIKFDAFVDLWLELCG